MPLSFKSENHGNIAFGFFNIESDMLLLENYFFFADDFCRLISDAAFSLPDETENRQGSGQKEPEFGLKVYHIADTSDIGDLMGAIHGVRFTGFIGETYKVFPFPGNPLDFKQNPEGYRTKKLIKELIKRFGKETEILIKLADDGHVSISSYVFDITVFFISTISEAEISSPNTRKKLAPYSNPKLYSAMSSVLSKKYFRRSERTI